MNKQRSVEELNGIISVLRKELSALKKYASSLESELKQFKGPEFGSPVASKSIPMSSPAKSTPTSQKSVSRASLLSVTPNRRPSSVIPRSVDKGKDRTDFEEGEEENYDIMSVVEVKLEMERLKESVEVQIQQLSDELKEVILTL